MKRRSLGLLLASMVTALLWGGFARAERAKPHKGIKDPGTRARYEREITAAAARWKGFEEAWLCAIIECESRFDPGATSFTGAAGLGQFTKVGRAEVQRLAGLAEYKEILGDLAPKLAKFSLDDAYDPDLAIEAAALMLQHIAKTYKNDLAAASTAYNAGSKAARAVQEHGFDEAKAKGLLTFSQAATYWPHVRAALERYRAQAEGPALVFELAEGAELRHRIGESGGETLQVLAKSQRLVGLSKGGGLFEMDWEGQKFRFFQMEGERKLYKVLPGAPLATVCVDTLNLREEPGTKAKVLGLMRRGCKVAVLARKGDWRMVQFGPLKAWAFAGKGYLVDSEGGPEPKPEAKPEAKPEPKPEAKPDPAGDGS